MNFEEIYNRYFRKVYAFAYSLSQDAHLAEEITQDTFFRALQHLDQFEGRSSVDSYLCSIAHNRYISILRSRKKNAPEDTLETVPSGCMCGCTAWRNPTRKYSPCGCSGNCPLRKSVRCSAKGKAGPG